MYLKGLSSLANLHSSQMACQKSPYIGLIIADAKKQFMAIIGKGRIEY